MWRMHCEIVVAGETLRSFESCEAFRQLNMKISWAFFFFPLKRNPNYQTVIKLIESPLGFSQESTVEAVQCRCNQLQYPPI